MRIIRHTQQKYTGKFRSCDEKDQKVSEMGSNKDDLENKAAMMVNTKDLWI